MKTTLKTEITDPEKTISGILQIPAAQLHGLELFLADCRKREADPDLATSILGELQRERVEPRIAEFRSKPIELRARRLADDWSKENVAELVEWLRANLAENTKSKDSFLSEIGKRVASISLEMFAPRRDRDALAADREKAEDQVAALENSIAAATSSIRYFELNPELQTFRAAAARVNEISMGSAGYAAA
jgi:hypothetical protein